jgi:hypothetical protein
MHFIITDHIFHPAPGAGEHQHAFPKQDNKVRETSFRTRQRALGGTFHATPQNTFS